MELESQLLAHSELFQNFSLYLLVATFVDANSLDPDQKQQNVGPDLDPHNLIVSLKDFEGKKVSR